MGLFLTPVVNRQPTDDRCYKKLVSEPTEEFSALITDSLDEMYENDEIGVNVYRTCNDRIGLSKDRIGLTYERTVYTLDTIELIHVMKD